MSSEGNLFNELSTMSMTCSEKILEFRHTKHRVNRIMLDMKMLIS